MIRAVTTTIYCLSCYRTNNTLISRIGLGGNYSYSHGIVVLKEAYKFDQKTYRDYFKEVTINNLMRARRVSYGLLSTSEGMVFADIVHKIKTGFELKR